MNALAAPGAVDLAVIATGMSAAVWDIRTRRIPNALTFGSAIVAVAFHALDAGTVRAVPGAIAWSAAGCAVGFLLFLPLFLLGGMGAGDVKLLAAMGAWLGPAAVCWVAIYGSVAGGVMALPLHRRATRGRPHLVQHLGADRLSGVWPGSGRIPV